MKKKVVLAYSGGLDTSVAIPWIREKYNADVVTLTVDVGIEKDYASIREKARQLGAVKALVVDAREPFVSHFVLPALQADAIYEGQYPLATALSRPLIAKLLVDAAREEKATAVAHGCTGKGNDQVLRCRCGRPGPGPGGYRPGPGVGHDPGGGDRLRPEAGHPHPGHRPQPLLHR